MVASILSFVGAGVEFIAGCILNNGALIGSSFAVVGTGVICIYISKCLIRDEERLSKVEKMVYARKGYEYNEKLDEYVKPDKKNKTEDEPRIESVELEADNYFFDENKRLHINKNVYKIYKIFDIGTINNFVQFHYDNQSIDVKLKNEEEALKFFKTLNKTIQKTKVK